MIENVLKKECLRCGLCCYEIGFLGTTNPCPYLDTTTNLCTRYNDRLGLKENGRYCILRQNSPVDYEGCPFNTGKQFMVSKNHELLIRDGDRYIRTKTEKRNKAKKKI